MAAASPILVLVAASGRSLRLDVHGGVRVDAIQRALLSFTSIPTADQLVMFNGARLDPGRTLGSYGLPIADPSAAEESPLFLYSRSLLKPGARVPECEALPDIVASVPASPSALQLHHPLESSPSPLVRGLPHTELQFQHDLAVAKAYWDASQLRVQRSRQLLSEQEVQARAADAARANVEVHFSHIAAAFQTFLNKFSSQHAAHAELLGSFDSDLAHLARIQLHPGLQANSSWRTLEDLTPVAKMRQWGEHCRRSHEHFGLKVSELGALLQALKQDVEMLLVQSPSVDLDQLGVELLRAEGAVDELSLVVQALAKDLRAARELVEQAVSDLADPNGAGSGVHDSSGAMQSIAEAHVRQLLPRASNLDACTAHLCRSCSAAKSCMSMDVVTQLQRISGQQSRIRDLKTKLAAFTEVLTRQEVAFAELKMANRIPTSYNMLLAECMRRQAWQDLFQQQAFRLEEHMTKLQAKEAHRRNAFLQQVERYLPNEAVAKAGLMQEPPRCKLQLTAPEQPVLAVSAADLQWLPFSSSASRSFLRATPPSSADMAAEMQYKPSASTSTEMENARLKSELASYIAAACVRELTASDHGPACSAVAGRRGADQGGAGATAVAPPNYEDLVASMQRAVELKENLVAALQGEVQSLCRQCAQQQERIRDLEDLNIKTSQTLTALEQQQQQAQIEKQQQQLPSAPRSSSPQGPGLLSPQPLVLGPIALAALSTCRPGSAGPPTLRVSSISTAVPLPQSLVLGRSDANEAAQARRLITFSSAPQGGGQQQKQQQQQQQQCLLNALNDTADAAKQQQHLKQQQQHELEPPKKLDRDDSGLSASTCSMQDSMVAGTMDEAPAAASPPRSRSCTSHTHSAALTGVLSMGMVASASQQGPGTLLEAAGPYGSLPFASSLPRYTSMCNITTPLGPHVRRPSADALSPIPNAVLASVMRAAGEEPDPLPWVHLRQQVMPARTTSCSSRPLEPGTEERGSRHQDECPVCVGHGEAATLESDTGEECSVGRRDVTPPHQRREEKGLSEEAFGTSMVDGGGPPGSGMEALVGPLDLPDDEAPDLDDIMAEEQDTPTLRKSDFLSVSHDIPE